MHTWRKVRLSPHEEPIYVVGYFAPAEFYGGKWVQGWVWERLKDFYDLSQAEQYVNYLNGGKGGG